MMANISDDSMLIITDCNGKSEMVMTSELQPYVFVGLQFTIDLIVGANGNATNFGFKVQWNEFPTPCPAQYSVNKTSPALYFDEMLSQNSVTLTAETRVSLVAFPSIYPDLTPVLRMTLVFDGPDITSPYLGSLFQAVRANKPIVSRSSQMTVFTFQENFLVGSFFVVQDYYNIANLSEVKGITCWSQSSCPLTLNAANGPVSAMTLNAEDGNEYIKKLDLSPNAVLKIYIGARKENDDSNLIVSYNLEQAKTNIPQKFNGDIMTYYLEKGTALVELAEDSNYTRWNDASVGREGFITSRAIGQLADYQDVYEYIGGLETNQTFAFIINVTYVDMSNNAELTINFGNETGKKEYKFSNNGNSTTRTFTALGTNMTVDYFTNGTETKGFYLDFKIDSVLTSAAHGSTLMILFAILTFSLL